MWFKRKTKPKEPLRLFQFSREVKVRFVDGTKGFYLAVLEKQERDGRRYVDDAMFNPVERYDHFMKFYDSLSSEWKTIPHSAYLESSLGSTKRRITEA